MTRIEQRLRAPARFASPPAGWTAGGYVLPDYGADDWIFDVMDEPEFWPAIDEAPAWTGACCLTTTNLATQAAQLNVDAGDDAGSATIALSGIRELVGTMLRGIVDGKAGPGITFGTFSGTRRRNADFEEARWVCLDIDAGTDGQPTPEITKLTDALTGAALLVYPTFSHGRVKGEQPAMGRYRVCLFFKQAVRTPEEFRRLHQHLGELLARHGFALDGSTKDAARHSYLPRWNPERLAPEYRDRHMWEPEPGWLAFHNGELLNLEALPDGEGGTVSLTALTSSGPEGDSGGDDRDSREEGDEPREATDTSPYGRRALALEAQRVAETAKGGRNATLYQAAASIGELVAGGEVVKAEAVDAFVLAAAECGLARDDGEAAVSATVESGLSAGMKTTRSAPSALPLADDGRRRRVELSGDRATQTQAVLEALSVSWDGTLFVQGGSLVQVVRTGGREPAVARFDRSRLQEYLGRRFEFVKKKADGSALCDLHERVVGNLMATPSDKLAVPRLNGVVRAPTFDKRGRLLIGERYDYATGLIISTGDLTFDVPGEPDEGDVKAAVEVLKELVTDFPLVDDSSFAHVVAVLVTGVARNMIEGPTPLFMISSPTAGTGKTLLATTISMVLTGREPDRVRYTRPDTEFAKGLTATLRNSPAVVLIDNLPNSVELRSPSLAEALTDRVHSARLLGGSTNVRVRVSSVWMATGNNCRWSAELADRQAVIRLVSDQERPRDRTGFKHELPQYAIEHRELLLSAIATLIRHWVSKGSKPGSKTLGSYESWARVVGGVLEAAGIDGFLENRDEYLDTFDEETEQWRLFVSRWWEKHGEEVIRVTDLLPGALDVGLVDSRSTLYRRRALMGDLLKGRKDAVIGSKRIVREWDSSSRGHVYRLEPVVTGGTPGGLDQAPARRAPK